MHINKRQWIVDIPNRLNRQFNVAAANRVWCGDITFVGARTLALSRGGA
jgi:transposase InsO family protein